jgi:predicted pyridoxine 5'-phosphate oxidase superfamily flavin-nucleotide-binding protein
MTQAFLDIASTPSVKAAQAANGSLGIWPDSAGDLPPDRFTAAEADFIAQRDSFYMATVSQSGWPYVQHRGGPAGFLRVLDDRTLACADLRGNRQYISTGNLAADDRAALFLMDYAARRRLKIFARVELKGLTDAPELAAQIALPGYRGKAERAMLFHLQAFDWNCPQHITPRFTQAEIEKAVAPLHDRIAELEAENAGLQAENDRLRTS